MVYLHVIIPTPPGGPPGSSGTCVLQQLQVHLSTNALTTRGCAMTATLQCQCCTEATFLKIKKKVCVYPFPNLPLLDEKNTVEVTLFERFDLTHPNSYHFGDLWPYHHVSGGETFIKMFQWKDYGQQILYKSIEGAM